MCAFSTKIFWINKDIHYNRYILISKNKIKSFTDTRFANEIGMSVEWESPGSLKTKIPIYVSTIKTSFHGSEKMSNFFRKLGLNIKRRPCLIESN